MGFLNESTAWACVSFVLWALAFYTYMGLGITLGYHRLLTHKSLKVPRWLMYLIVSGGYMALMGSPIVWVGVHRLHHQKSDIPGEDPHTPLEGFKHALYGWMFDMRRVQSDEELQKQVPDLMADPLFRALGDTHDPWQAQLCLGVCIVARVLVLLMFGPMVLAANIVATFTIFWSTQLVNAVCHQPTAGYRLHDTREGSRNVWWVALLALGEGWHNNHHAVPKSARHGMAWWEFDFTWVSIWALEKLGLATNVIRPPKAFTTMRAPKANESASPLSASILPSVEPIAEPVLAETN